MIKSVWSPSIIAKVCQGLQLGANWLVKGRATHPFEFWIDANHAFGKRAPARSRQAIEALLSGPSSATTMVPARGPSVPGSKGKQ